MNIYVFRVILDTEEDVFRDIEVATDSSFEELHSAIKQAFDFEGEEMSSFYMSDEHWNKGTEIPLIDMGLTEDITDAFMMSNVKLEDMINSPSEKILYVYDYLRMWCFYVELVSIKKGIPSTIYPKVALVYGDAPAADSKDFDLDLGLVFLPEGEAEEGDSESETYRTGDPEIDQYLDDEDESGNEDFGNIDDLDDSYY